MKKNCWTQLLATPTIVGAVSCEAVVLAERGGGELETAGMDDSSNLFSILPLSYITAIEVQPHP